jgi:hypothetical protein
MVTAEIQDLMTRLAEEAGEDVGTFVGRMITAGLAIEAFTRGGGEVFVRDEDGEEYCLSSWPEMKRFYFAVVGVVLLVNDFTGDDQGPQQARR